MTVPRSFCIIVMLVLFLILGPAARCGEAQEVSFYAVGDVMLGRYIAKTMTARGSDYPFSKITAALHSADIVFGNLETAISTNDKAKASFPDKPYNFHASAAAAPALKRAGFQVLSLANNHAMDYGPSALLETRRLLDKEGIANFGAGKDLPDARKPAIVTVRNVRFGFLGYGVAHSGRVYATAQRAGIAPVRMDSIRRDIEAARANVDVLIVSLHWGMEYEKSPSEVQRNEAHQIIDWGADLILGHHPHVMQGMEVYKGKLIAYSLGNFLFDQKNDWTNKSVILACKFRGKVLSEAGIIPLDRFRSYFPKVAEGESKKNILEHIRNISAPLNSAMTVPEGGIFLLQK